MRNRLVHPGQADAARHLACSRRVRCLSGRSEPSKRAGPNAAVLECLHRGRDRADHPTLRYIRNRPPVHVMLDPDRVDPPRPHDPATRHIAKIVRGGHRVVTGLASTDRWTFCHGVKSAV